MTLEIKMVINDITSVLSVKRNIYQNDIIPNKYQFLGNWRMYRENSTETRNSDKLLNF